MHSGLRRHFDAALAVFTKRDLQRVDDLSHGDTDSGHIRSRQVEDPMF